MKPVDFLSYDCLDGRDRKDRFLLFSRPGERVSREHGFKFSADEFCYVVRLKAGVFTCGCWCRVGEAHKICGDSSFFCFFKASTLFDNFLHCCAVFEDEELECVVRDTFQDMGEPFRVGHVGVRFLAKGQDVLYIRHVRLRR